MSLLFVFTGGDNRTDVTKDGHHTKQATSKTNLLAERMNIS